jgi:hypothetical protein
VHWLRRAWALQRKVTRAGLRKVGPTYQSIQEMSLENPVDYDPV